MSRILLISGSSRAASTNTAVLRTAADVVSGTVSTDLFTGLSDLPAFNPDDDHDPLPAPLAALRRSLSQADAVLFCTPEYAGTLPGSLKNLLDWTVGGTEMSGKPVGWINVSSVAAPTGGAGAHATLAMVLGYVSADVVEDACATAPMSRDAVGVGGTVTDEFVRQQLARCIDALVRRVHDGRA
jgi:chromate reductase